MRHRELQQMFAEKRESFPNMLQLRMHRAISWIDRAERSDNDDDSRFIFYWISLNAAYSTDDTQDGTSEMALLDAFLEQIVELDDERVLHGLMSKEFSNLQILLQEKYIFKPFWDDGNWAERLQHETMIVNQAFRAADTGRILSIVLRRLYTLRNQLVHGGATWNGSLNRPQVEDGARMLAGIVPRIVRLMMDNPDRHQQWGRCPYPALFPPGDRRGSVPPS